MKRTICLLLFAAMLCGIFCGCHGSAERNAFAVPDSFDTSRQYEITFWAKNDTNLTQVKIYEKAIADFRRSTPTSK